MHVHEHERKLGRYIFFTMNLELIISFFFSFFLFLSFIEMRVFLLK